MYAEDTSNVCIGLNSMYVEGHCTHIILNVQHSGTAFIEIYWDLLAMQLTFNIVFWIKNLNPEDKP